MITDLNINFDLWYIYSNKLNRSYKYTITAKIVHDIICRDPIAVNSTITLMFNIIESIISKKYLYKSFIINESPFL